MNHPDDLIALALDDALPRSEQARLNAHIAGCPRCRTLLHDQQQLDRRLRARRRPAPPPDFARRIQAQVALLPAPRPPFVWQVALIGTLFALGIASVIIARSDFFTLAQYVGDSASTLVAWAAAAADDAPVDADMFARLGDSTNMVLVFGLCLLGSASMLLLRQQEEAS